MINISELKKGITINENLVILSLFAQPNARKTEFEKIHDQQLKIKVHAVAEDGKANSEIILYLANFFSLRKNQIAIISGHSHRKKRIQLSFDVPMSLEIINEYFRQN